MADNITLNAGSGGVDLATDEDGSSKHHQWTKMEYGADGTFTPVTAAAPLPIGVNTAKDGSGTLYAPLVDADGHFQIDVLSIAAGDNNIGNVDIISLPAGNLGARAMVASLSTTIATDDTHFGAVGAASDVDGVVHGQLRYMGEYIATIDADTGAIKTAVELLDNAVDGSYLNVNVNAAGTDLSMNAGVLTAQTQRVTIATDDEVNNLLGTIDADTSNMATSLGNLDNAVDGNYLNVNVNLAGTDADSGEGALSANTLRVTQATDDDGVAHLSTIATKTTSMEAWDDGSDHCEVILVTGAAAIGKLAANSGVDIGDVDVTSVVPGVAATNLGKAKGSVAGATDTGVAPLAVRNDDLADLAGADGDYTPLQVDSQGALYVNQGMAEMKQASGVAAGGAPGTDDMIAAVGGKKIVICALALFATSATTNSVFVDNVDNDLIANTGNPIPLSVDADGDTVPGFALPFNPGGWCKTDTVNEAVTLNSSAAQDIVWCITYFETD